MRQTDQQSDRPRRDRHADRDHTSVKGRGYHGKDLILPIRETKKDVDQKKEAMRQSKGKNKEDMP